MTEKEKLKLLDQDMWCNKYNMCCADVPYEVLYYVGPCGFSNYDCDLICNDCEKMERW